MTATKLSTFATCLLIATLTPLAEAETLVGPTAPGNLSATAGPAIGEITLAWEAASSLLGVTAYRVYHVDADGASTLVAEVAGDVLGWTESGLAAGTTVTYAVTAVDPLTEGPQSNLASATAFGLPGAPAITVASGPGPVGESTVSWTTPYDGGLPITEYRIYRDGALVASVGGDASAWTDTGLTPLTAHAYAVSAVNAAGEGPTSDAACGMPSPWTPELGCGGLA